MSQVNLEVNSIDALYSAMRPNSSAVDIKCDMTEGQMFDALCSFLENVSSATWQRWIVDVGDV